MLTFKINNSQFHIATPSSPRHTQVDSTDFSYGPTVLREGCCVCAAKCC